MNKDSEILSTQNHIYINTVLEKLKIHNIVHKSKFNNTMDSKIKYFKTISLYYNIQ